MRIDHHIGETMRPAPVMRPVCPILDFWGPSHQIDALQVLGENLMPKNTPQKMIFTSGQGKSQIIGIVRILARQAARDEFASHRESLAVKEVTDAAHDENPHA